MSPFSEKYIEAMAMRYYGVKATAVNLHGELDLNFHMRDSAGVQYLLKIANPSESREQLLMQNAIMKDLCKTSDSLNIQQVLPSIYNEEIVSLEAPGGPRFMRLLTWIDGQVLAKVNPHSQGLLFKVGEMCGELSKALSGFDHTLAHRFVKWDPSNAQWVKDHHGIFEGMEKALFEYYLELFDHSLPLLKTTRCGVNHNDANDHNILVAGRGGSAGVAGILDFGDAVYTHTINELAIALAYVMMNKVDPLEAALPVVSGYHSRFRLEENEMSVLFTMITARLMISVTCSALNRIEHPDNDYLLISEGPAWDLLGKLRRISPDFAHYAFRNACGLEACTRHQRFTSWAMKHYQDTVAPVGGLQDACWLDLSVGTLDMGGMNDLLDPDLLHHNITGYMADMGAAVAIGRYDEARAFYVSDAFEAQGNDGPHWRTFHIGMDFFAGAGIEIFAVFDGTVFSIADNNAERDYGPTIILEHRVSGDLVFYSLYGHLTRTSLKSLRVGQPVKCGQVLGQIGSRTENGNWPPHLHFQIVLDMLDNRHDFPGVAKANDRVLWKSLSPDPWMLLTGNPSPENSSLPKAEIVDYRKKHLGKNLSISYREPIKVVRGAGVFLLDDTGRRYLDTVNNVAHVGHENQRVVDAGQRQMAVLNTNTRYLHENIVRFSEALLNTMPDGLNVAYIVNSGSEANELALRLAKQYTGQQDFVVSEAGYHGNTNACIEISSYKFDGPGGRGAGPNIHVIPIPDVYRGKYRSDEPAAGARYAGHVQEAVMTIGSMGRKPAGLIIESVISCGGQIELPKDFLNNAYEYIRNAGGVCIADEVQTGCGRAGDHFWAFSAHGVVPDIVTIGKPIGNGHPLAAVVTTQAIADAFRNGMEYFNTFGGNPVSCAIGLEVLKVIRDEGLQENSLTIGNYLKSGLISLMDQFEIIGDVRGPGLFIGFELVKDRFTREPATKEASYLANRMRDKGILMSTDGPFNNVIKIKPPIIFSKTNSDVLLNSIGQVLKEDFMVIKE